MNPPLDAVGSRPPRSLQLRIVLGLVFFTVVVFGMVLARDRLSLADLARHEATLREFQHAHPLLVYGVALLVYVAVTGLSIPAATVLSLLYAWYFGFWRAVLVVNFGSTAGATLAFLMSRFLLRDFVQQRFGEHLSRFNTELDREGAYYLFTLRLLPVVPFFVVNAVMGLTPIRVRTFWWVSQLGMLPGTLVYVYAGSTAPDLGTLADRGIEGLPWGKIAIALTLLGVLPLATRWWLRAWRRTKWSRLSETRTPASLNGPQFNSENHGKRD